MPATSSRRWRRRRTGSRTWPGSSRAIFAALDSGLQRERDAAWTRLVQRLDGELVARVEEVVRLTPTIVEVIVRAPAAARHFHPGQFYRLQNFESADAPRRHDAVLDGRDCTDRRVGGQGARPAVADCARARRVEPALCLSHERRAGRRDGPTGAPTEILEGRNVLLLGGGLGNAVLFSIAKAMREHGNRVIYFAGYKRGEDLFKREDIEAATHQVIWSTDMGRRDRAGASAGRALRGNIVQAMLAYQRGELASASCRCRPSTASSRSDPIA